MQKSQKFFNGQPKNYLDNLISFIDSEDFPLWSVLKSHHLGRNVFIDSCRVILPLSKVEIIDPRFNAPFTRVYPGLEEMDPETGQIMHVMGFPGDKRTKRVNGKWVDVKDKKNKKHKLEQKPDHIEVRDGITYRFYFKKYIEPGYKEKLKINPDYVPVSTECCVIQVSAKASKEKYFDGITEENLRTFLKDINDIGIIKLDMETFLDYSNTSDIDVCMQTVMEMDDLDKILSVIREFFKTANVFNKPKNKGFSIGSRSTKNLPSKPFSKMYHKGLELKNKSSEFFYKYLEPNMRNYQTDRLVRWEVNIQNSAHKKHLIKHGCNAHFKTLRELLETPREDLYKIVKTIAGFHFNKKKVTRAFSKAGMGFSDYALLHFIEYAIENGKTLDQIRALVPLWLLDCFPNLNAGYKKVKKSRENKKLDTLIAMLVDVEKEIKQKLNQNNRIYTSLDLFGIHITKEKEFLHEK